MYIRSETLAKMLASILVAAMLIFVSGASTVQAQLNHPITSFDSTSVTVGTIINGNVAGLNSDLPFWLHAKQNGLYDQRSANGLIYTSFNKPLLTDSKVKLRASGRLVGHVSESSNLGLNTLSVEARYSIFAAQAGKFIDPMGMNYHPLSSGSMIYSSNAEPVPKVMLKTNGFVDIPLTRGHVQFSSYLSHGWFEDSRYVKNAFLHQKYLYLKINYKMLEGIGGIIHNSQWGGRSATRGSLPSSIKDYFRMVFAQGAADGSQAPGGEQTNSLGNSIGAYDFNLRINLDDFRLTFYRLFYLEDKVSTRFRSPWDGIWGGGIIFKEEKPLLKALLYEHMNTKRQDSFDYEPRGSQRYYHNFIYRSGWTYKNRVLGNPLILVDGSNDYPLTNNIIIAHHLGANGFLTPNIKWKAFYTFSRNYGVVEDQIIRRLEGGRPNTIYAELRPLEELKKVNHSIFLRTSYDLPKVPRLNIQFGLAADIGQLHPDRLGVMAGASYRIVQ